MMHRFQTLLSTSTCAAPYTTDVCAIPMEQWYNFRPAAARQVISLEEAEERMEARSRNATTTSRWLERAKGGGADDDDGGSDSGGGDMKANVSSDDEDDNDYDSKKVGPSR